jgi:hypothetical protein
MSSHMELLRIESSPQGVLGVLSLAGQAVCLTLEPPDLDNQPRISCVPEGEYAARRLVSPRFGETFGLVGVPGREHILIHSGNTVHDTQGCILVGQSFGRLPRGRGVLRSRAAFTDLMDRLSGQDACVLNIRSARRVQAA